MWVRWGSDEGSLGSVGCQFGSDVVRLRLTEKGEECLGQLTMLHIAELSQLAPLLAH